jgi:pSer/pThr/pTyr-binding forkhead associated (FHA) protein
MELKLVVLAGAKQGLEIPLKKDKFLIGRAKECSLRAGSEAISRRHCAILRKDGRWTVRDLGSRNGTYVNDSRISEEVPLAAGDELRVGPLKFRIAPIDELKTAPAQSSSTAEQRKPRKQPPVKDVADVIQRTVSKSDDSATEEDISRWLLGTADPNGEATMKETMTMHLDETQAHSRVPMAGKTPTEKEVNDVAGTLPDESAESSDDSAAEGGDQGGGWGLFKRGKAAAPKHKPGKLPPRADQPSKDSREAAADILREMTRRR